MYLMAGRVRYSEVGLDGGLTLHHLINYFQDCSTFHLEDIGLGLDYFQSQNLAFFILSWQIEINRLRQRIHSRRLPFARVKLIQTAMLIIVTM